MCTIAVLYRVHPEYPVVIAANRDEFYQRPASPPAPWPGAPHLLAGRDQTKGGSWMGATRSGFFVGLTNQRTHQPAATDRLSRGEVVLGALRAGSTDAALRYLRRLDATQYNPFNLLFGDASGLQVAYARDRPQLEFAEVKEGVHVLPNDVLDAPSFPKAARAAALIAPHAGQAWPALREALARALSDHARPPLPTPSTPPSDLSYPHPQPHLPPPPPNTPFSWVLTQLLGSLCIHTPTYGTRSSTLVALSSQSLAHYLYADGPPCQTPFLRRIPAHWTP